MNKSVSSELLFEKIKVFNLLDKLSDICIPARDSASNIVDMI